ncbi:DNA polymerase III subunit gamma/tau [Nitratidesulfovibrio sp. SRB-5]|uniref:DNA polymerase III subunit gamma/tau n=1 Tax=Nitratidesulfovibrio sp. SRB-5 TaxID=2872636 RepID=UPI00102542AE|nr:DNA polymerase III subunit gamma/tau [Nitratidesulfovibrio sp. SRB-5]MBZ2170433.1 DNA polymerase III subunit gamma/tau [Nitratidesulfovibrio sp. SRB-5]RXF78204.1 DNA polymerase III subunit gamma/tau [Desulfovibrio sp. DS-1]
MSNAPLTARYRPQTFAEVAGQETVKAILSRAAAEDRVAPAYLFSGTRGVGKTTIARILAKALNCEKAPTGEPCNTCEQCRKVVMGNHVDVVEIDGASNRGIEDARRLREAIGYAPMEGRYKVFIIDEAHMLTREAFNALLKTLEEPPPRVTFVLATTEPHKFPVTIISRCQHFTFKRLPENELEAHLTGVLTREGQDFDPAAVRLIARRAAGSVRDSMSLLGQVLALGGDRLTVEGARGVLGLAGQELFFEVMQALASQDCVAVSAVVRDLLDKGVDIGFFLRELAATWRNLFMLRQAGEAALPALDLPEEEARQWLEWAPKFEITHIHACWQMTLEGQRRVLTSLEPAMALELLLLNLAMLPRLVSLEQLSRGGGAGPAGGRGVPGGVGGAGGGPAGGSGMPGGGAGGHGSMPPRQGGYGGYGGYGGQGGQGGYGAQSGQFGQSGQSGESFPQAQPPQGRYPGPGQVRPQAASSASSMSSSSGVPGVPGMQPAGGFPRPERAAPAAAPAPSRGGSDTSLPWDDVPYPAPGAGAVPGGTAVAGAPGGSGSPDGVDAAPDMASAPAPQGEGTWDGFVRYCAERSNGGNGLSVLGQARGRMDGGRLIVETRFRTQYEHLCSTGNQAALAEYARAYFGDGTTVEVQPPTTRIKTPSELRAEAERHPAVGLLREQFGATMLSCRPLSDSQLQ